MTYSRALQTLVYVLEASAVEAARRKAEWILMDGCGIDRIRLIAYPETEINPATWETCLSQARRCAAGEPLQYVLGYADFFNLRLRVTPDVLIPRPETEQLADLLLTEIADRPNPRILDVGTGSGCIALAVQFGRPDARVWACDHSEAALKVAFRNRIDLRLPVSFFAADALVPGFARALTGVLDVVVSNPPYVAREEEADLPTDVVSYEPHTALFAPADPLAFYPAIAAEAAAVLRPNGRIFFEVHEERADEVAALVGTSGFAEVRVERDFSGRPRFVKGVLKPSGG